MTSREVDNPPEKPRPATIFRREALEHRAEKQGKGDVIRVAPRWTTWAFFVLLAFLAAGLVAAGLVEIDRYVPGTTATDERGRIVVLLPAALAPGVTPGAPVELDDTTTEVVAAGDEVLHPADVRDLYGVDVVAPSRAVMTALTGEQHGGRTARVLVESEPAIIALVPGLRALLGGG